MSEPETMGTEQPETEISAAEKYDQMDALLSESFDDVEPITDENKELLDYVEGGEDDESEQHDSDQEDAKDVQPLDYDQEINVPMPEGVAQVTIGKLKDNYIAQERITLEQQEQSNTLMRDRQQISEFVESLGQIQLPADAVAKLQHHRQQQTARENELMLSAIPEWKDGKIFQEDRAEMAELSTDYGLSEKDINAISDHRFVKMLRDFTKLKGQMKKARATFDDAKPQSRTPVKKPNKQKRVDKFEHAAQSTDRGVKLAAIDDLLGVNQNDSSKHRRL